MTRVLVTGGAGRMGREAALALLEAEDLTQVAAVDVSDVGEEVAPGESPPAQRRLFRSSR
jgi:NAD(P)-dependent dehydrogenase (short-subunit alcohol dehydrogenase family)